MFENQAQKLLPAAEFVRRLVVSVGFAIVLMSAALLVGVLGYHLIAGLPWVDALLNASMILGGMGPVDPLTTKSAKVFASFYALFSGLVFIGVVTIVLTPVAHRLLHSFHIADEDLDPGDKKPSD
jgi:hypothetical protein